MATRINRRALPILCFAGIAGTAFYSQSSLAQQAPAVPAPSGRAPDPRVQQRSYDFAFPGNFRVAHVSLPYAVFVSSKVTKDKKNPLIIALHGLGGNPNTLMRGNLLDLAEAGGYIVFAPAGYNPRGWYGIPWTVEPRPGATPRSDPAAINDPPNLSELAEKDVMDLLGMARREFVVDERRTYLMGHSMGGAGTLYLGSKYGSTWAALAAIAPAARRMESHRDGVLTGLTMPVLVVQGDADTAVPVEDTRKWVAAMKDRKMDHRYREVPGGTHGSVIATGMPEVFAFFDAHSK
ncbi:MAG: prolyl oligopeptidase family serine peptidase [Acidobacteriia bacterium]|nr:prolyl oligopeptidase family serine peptidase [Terriglobia bacterium]